jgi:cytochrome oxidase Cu insertion factor (SCO1/SenC/PrrC family)
MWIGLLGLVLAGVSVWRWTRPVDSVRLAEYRRVPEFSLTERSGKTIRRADLLGRVSIVDFFYTRCAETCPLQSACLARLQSEPLLYSNVLLVSITMDPDYDTPAVLADYATRLHADRRRWLFLTGPRSAIYRLAVDGFGLAAFSSRRPEHVLSQTWLGLSAAWAHEGSASSQIIRLVHASRFAVVDRAGRIRDYVDGADPTAIDGLLRIVNQLLRERPEPADPSPS